jgi:hypothetical protein
LTGLNLQLLVSLLTVWQKLGTVDWAKIAMLAGAVLCRVGGVTQMATIRELVNAEGTRTLHVQVRVRGFPARTASLPTRRQAERWAKTVEATMIKGTHFRDIEGRGRTLGEGIDRYLRAEVLKKRAGSIWRVDLPWRKGLNTMPASARCARMC